MNAETLAIAYRLLVSRKWVWMPGMAEDSGGARFVAMEGPGRHRFIGPTRGKWHLIIGTPFPDLDDELTRAGVLAVVRRALGVPTLTTLALGVSEPEPGEVVPEWRLAGIPDSMPELWRVRGASEIEVLCLALEAAQQ